MRAAVAVAILTFGEIGASKIVATPGGELFAHDVFARMHYGTGNQLAAMCLLLLATAAAGGACRIHSSSSLNGRINGNRTVPPLAALWATASVNSM